MHIEQKVSGSIPTWYTKRIFLHTKCSLHNYKEKNCAFLSGLNFLLSDHFWFLCITGVMFSHWILLESRSNGLLLLDSLQYNKWPWCGFYRVWSKIRNCCFLAPLYLISLVKLWWWWLLLLIDQRGDVFSIEFWLRGTNCCFFNI